MASPDRFFSATLTGGRLNILGLIEGQRWDPSRFEWREEPELDTLVNPKAGDRKVRTPAELDAILAGRGRQPRLLWIHEGLLERARRFWERATPKAR